MHNTFFRYCPFYLKLKKFFLYAFFWHLSQHFWVDCYSLKNKIIFFVLRLFLKTLYTFSFYYKQFQDVKIQPSSLFSSLLFFNFLTLLLVMIFSNFSICFDFVHHLHILLDFLLLSFYILIKVPSKISIFSSIYFFCDFPTLCYWLISVFI